jgi:hypothetical protein
MKKHLIVTNEIDVLYGSYDAAFDVARDALMEDDEFESREDIPEIRLWNWLGTEVDVEVESFLDSVKGADKEHSDYWLVIADLGLWFGRRKSAKLFGSLKKAIDACLDKIDYFTINEDQYGNVSIRAIHHDGANNYKLYRLSEAGVNRYENAPSGEEDIKTCQTLWNNKNFHRAANLRKLFGWV